MGMSGRLGAYDKESGLLSIEVGPRMARLSPLPR